MAVGTGTALAALAVGGAAASAFGKSKTKPATSESGFAAMPPEVQKVLLETYLPAATSRFNKPFEARPMQRANTTPGMFDSIGLADLQKYSDSVGGIFNPAPREDMSNASAVDKEVQAKYGMNLYDYITTQRPDVMDALGGGGGKSSVADKVLDPGGFISKLPDPMGLRGKLPLVGGIFGKDKGSKFSQLYGTGDANSDAAVNWWNAWGNRGY